MRRFSTRERCLVVLLGLAGGGALGAVASPSRAIAMDCAEVDTVDAEATRISTPSPDIPVWTGSSIDISGTTFWLVSSDGERLGYWALQKRDSK